MAGIKNEDSHDEPQAAHLNLKEHGDGELMVWDAAAERRVLRKIDWRVRLLAELTLATRD